MGRPINKKFFGNLNKPSNTGGEGVNTITVSNSGTHYSAGSVVSIGAPQLAGGARATISYSRNAAGNLSVTKVTAGSGYTSAPSITVTKAATVTSTTNSGVTATNTFTVSSVTGIEVGMLIAGAATGSAGYVQSVNGNVITSSVVNNSSWTNAANLTFTDSGASFAASSALFATGVTQNAIAFTSYISTGSSAIAGGDIIKQESSRRYQVRNAQGTGVVKLVTAAPAAGEMNIIATDADGNTYYVKKLTARRVVLVQKTGSTSEFETNSAAGWTLGSPAAGIVSIASV